MNVENIYGLIYIQLQTTKLKTYNLQNYLMLTPTHPYIFALDTILK